MRFLWLVVGVLVVGAAPLGAQEDPADFVAIAARDGSYAAEDSGVDAARLDDVVADARNEGSRFYAVALAEDPPGGATAAADLVLDETGSGTIVVLSPGFLGYASDEYDDGDLQDADDASVDEFDGDEPVEGFAAFAEALEESEGGGGGRLGSGLLWVLLFVVGLPVVVFLLTRRQRHAAPLAAPVGGSVADARAELERQVAAVADGILELSDRVTVSGDESVKERFAEANATYLAVSEDLPGLDTVPELEAAADRLDRARWQVEATRAVLEGRPVPPEPVEGGGACFFDPDHGAGTEQAEVRADGVGRTVLVCRPCADEVAAGRSPAVRTITVDGEEVPAASAPRSYGGGRFDNPGLFDVLFGGGTAHQDWSGYGGGYRRRRRLGFGGGFGGGGFGGGGFGGGGGRASGGRRRSGGGGRARGGRRR